MEGKGGRIKRKRERERIKGMNIHVFSGNRWKSSRNSGATYFHSFHGLVFPVWQLVGAFSLGVGLGETRQV
jgi:hypothetical protein